VCQLRRTRFALAHAAEKSIVDIILVQVLEKVSELIKTVREGHTVSQTGTHRSKRQDEGVDLEQQPVLIPR
jgi:hypothetical protein